MGRGGVRDVRRGGVVNHDVGGCLWQNVDLPAGGPCPPVGTRVHLRPGRGRSSSGSPCSTEEGTPGGEGGPAEHGPAVKSLYSHRLSSSLCEAPELEPHREHDKLPRVTKGLLVDVGVFLPSPEFLPLQAPKHRVPPPPTEETGPCRTTGSSRSRFLWKTPYTAEMSSLIVAVTSGCRRTGTLWSPTDVIALLISIRRVSRSGPPEDFTASAMSAGVTEPNRRPPSPARCLSRTVSALICPST